jgi:hypothetical protein
MIKWDIPWEQLNTEAPPENRNDASGQPNGTPNDSENEGHISTASPVSHNAIIHDIYWRMLYITR